MASLQASALGLTYRKLPALWNKIVSCCRGLGLHGGSGPWVPERLRGGPRGRMKAGDRVFDYCLWPPRASENFLAFELGAALAGVVRSLCGTELSLVGLAGHPPWEQSWGGARSMKGTWGRSKVSREFAQLSHLNLVSYLKACRFLRQTAKELFPVSHGLELCPLFEKKGMLSLKTKLKWYTSCQVLFGLQFQLLGTKTTISLFSHIFYLRQRCKPVWNLCVSYILHKYFCAPMCP